jgi:hypothetical protein
LAANSLRHGAEYDNKGDTTMAQSEFLQGEIADRFLSETEVEGVHDHEAALALSSLMTTIILISCLGYCVFN